MQFYDKTILIFGLSERDGLILDQCAPGRATVNKLSLCGTLLEMTPLSGMHPKSDWNTRKFSIVKKIGLYSVKVVVFPYLW